MQRSGQKCKCGGGPYSGATAGYRLQINTGAAGNASDLLAAAQAYGDGDGLSLIGLTGVGGNVSAGLGDAGHVGDRGGNVVQLIGLNFKVNAAAVCEVGSGDRRTAVACPTVAGVDVRGDCVAVVSCHADRDLGALGRRERVAREPTSRPIHAYVNFFDIIGFAPHT